MKLPFFSKKFFINDEKLSLSNSILLNHLRDIAYDNKFYFYENNYIFHHASKILIPFILFIPNFGIYIFEYKNWTYDELKKMNITKAINQISSQNTLAFESTHLYIKEKFSEVVNTDNINIFHFVIIENLSKNEYYRLDNIFHQLIPAKYILFQSCTQDDIKERLLSACTLQNNLLTANFMICVLFLQMTLLSNNKITFLTSKEQQDIIQDDIRGLQYIACKDYCGKSKIIIIKALYEYLKNRTLNIIIIAPTFLAVQLLKKYLLEIVEYNIVDIDFSKIKIIQPKDFRNKKYNIIFIDGSYCFEQLKITKKNKNILVFEYFNQNHTYKYKLTKNYADLTRKIIIKADLFLELFLKLKELLDAKHKLKDILIITTNDENSQKVMEDLIDFQENISPILLNKNSALELSESDNILVAKYNALHGISRKYIIIINPIDIEHEILNFIYSRATKLVYVLYEEKEVL